MYKRFTKLHISELLVKALKVNDTRGHSLKLEKLGCAKIYESTSYLTEWLGVGMLWTNTWWMHLVSMLSSRD